MSFYKSKSQVLTERDDATEVTSHFPLFKGNQPTVSSNGDNKGKRGQACESDLETKIKVGNNNSKLIVNSDPSSLGKVLLWFESLKKPFIPMVIWLECQTVLGEAFDNAVIHAHKELSSETTIEIELEILSQLIIIKVWDQGPGFDLESQRIKVSQGIDDYAEHGRGVQIFEKVADYFSYCPEQDGRNCLLIIKFLNHKIQK